jgi:mono/diheme cytochrome c family protein
MRFHSRLTVLLLMLSLVACRDSPPEEQRENRVSAAAAQITELTFDTIAWPSQEVAVERGGIVWQYSCRKCHGNWGDGDGGFVMRGDTVRPPTFRQPDWRFADDPDGLRRQIFTGTDSIMPHWGLEGLKPRDVDAVATWIHQILLNR